MRSGRESQLAERPGDKPLSLLADCQLSQVAVLHAGVRIYPVLPQPGLLSLPGLNYPLADRL